MSAPAASLQATALPVPAAPRPRGRVATALPLAGGLLLGLGIALGDPRLLVLGVLPLMVAVIARPDGAMLLFAAGLYLNLPVLVAAQVGLPSALSGAFALLLLIPFVGYVVIGRAPLVVTPALVCILGWLVVLVLSAGLSGGSPTSVNEILTFLGEGLLLYLLVTNVVRTVRTLRAVMWVLVLAGALMGIVSVWQELTHSYSHTLFGFAQVNQVGFSVGNDVTGPEVRPRLAGPIGEKNTYARILLVLLPLVLALIRTERDRLAQLVAAGCGGLILCGIALTFSRSAAVVMALLLVVAVVLRVVPIRHALLLVAAVVAVVLAVAPQYVLRLQTLSTADTATEQTSTADNALRGRATENLAAFYVFRDHPIIGVGPHEFYQRYSQVYGNKLDLRYLETSRRAHNLYLEIAADTGVIGLSVFLAIVGVTLVQLWGLARFWRRHRRYDLEAYAQGLVLALTGYLLTGVFLQLNYERYFWLLVALANAAIWILRRVPVSAAPAAAAPAAA